MFCKHEWIRVGKLERLKDAETMIAMCLCKKCGKYKQKKFTGRIIGYLVG